MITEKMIQINHWGICRNLLQMQWLNLTLLFCLWAQETKRTSKYVFLTLSLCTTLCSAKGVCKFFWKHLVRQISVWRCFPEYFAKVSGVVCCFNLPRPFAKFELVRGDLRWDTISLKAHFSLLQCSILTDTGPYFLDEWVYYLLLRSSLRTP